jgi:hypothetical protein
VFVLALATASCGAPRLKLPSGPGQPAPDAPSVLSEATTTCRGIRTLSAEVGVSGRVNGQRLRGRLLVGTASPASARIEASAPFGGPAFIFVAVQDDATLLLPRDNRVLEHGRSDQILAALTGVPLTAGELSWTLLGCWPADVIVRRALQYGSDWRVVFVEPDHEVSLHRANSSAPWRLVAVLRNLEHSGRRWTAQYGDFQNDLPRSIRIMSADSESAGTYDLTLSLSQLETNVSLGPDVFRVQIPPSAQPITLEELRRARPGIREN